MKAERVVIPSKGTRVVVSSETPDVNLINAMNALRKENERLRRELSESSMERERLFEEKATLESKILDLVFEVRSLSEENDFSERKASEMRRDLSDKTARLAVSADRMKGIAIGLERLYRDYVSYRSIGDRILDLHFEVRSIVGRTRSPSPRKRSPERGRKRSQ
jgi:chromosome segregation ATPase